MSQAERILYILYNLAGVFDIKVSHILRLVSRINGNRLICLHDYDCVVVCVFINKDKYEAHKVYTFIMRV